jgi:hypothetical protein
VREVVAVTVGDMHLSHKVPVARGETQQEWYDAMAHAIKQVNVTAKAHSCPVLVAGDVFDRWNSPPQLINHAIECIKDGPNWYGIPGQHDLPFHRYDDMDKSGYGTLVKAGVITDLAPNWAVMKDGFMVVGFPWGTPVTPFDSRARHVPVTKRDVRIALIHSYAWQRGHTHPGAKEEDRIGSERWKEALTGYDVAVFGDNHSGFSGHMQTRTSEVYFVNNGGMMARRSDERYYEPFYSMITNDGTVATVPFDTSRDKWSDHVLTAPAERAAELEEFVKSLTDLGDKALDFLAALKSAAKDLPPNVRRILKEAIDSAEEVG